MLIVVEIVSNIICMLYVNVHILYICIHMHTYAYICAQPTLHTDLLCLECGHTKLISLYFTAIPDVSTLLIPAWKLKAVIVAVLTQDQISAACHCKTTLVTLLLEMRTYSTKSCSNLGARLNLHAENWRKGC